MQSRREPDRLVRKAVDLLELHPAVGQRAGNHATRFRAEIDRKIRLCSCPPWYEAGAELATYFDDVADSRKRGAKPPDRR